MLSSLYKLQSVHIKLLSVNIAVVTVLTNYVYLHSYLIGIKLPLFFSFLGVVPNRNMFSFDKYSVWFQIDCVTIIPQNRPERF